MVFPRKFLDRLNVWACVDVLLLLANLSTSYWQYNSSRQNSVRSRLCSLLVCKQFLRTVRTSVWTFVTTTKQPTLVCEHGVHCKNTTYFLMSQMENERVDLSGVRTVRGRGAVQNSMRVCERERESNQ
jgi:hypothetical protein